MEASFVIVACNDSIAEDDTWELPMWMSVVDKEICMMSTSQG